MMWRALFRRSRVEREHAADPLVFGAVTGILALTAVAASILPARRATRVDPNVALRAD